MNILFWQPLKNIGQFSQHDRLQVHLDLLLVVGGELQQQKVDPAGRALNLQS